MTFWPLTNSDFPTDQTFYQFYDLYTELDLHRIMSGFHGAFATGVASQQGTLTLPDTWFRPPFRDLLMLQLLRPNSSNLPCLYTTFHLEYPLVLSRFCLLLGLTSPKKPSKETYAKQKRSTEGCSKLKSPETRQVQDRLVSTLEHMQVPKWDRTRCPEEKASSVGMPHRCICSMETLHN